MAYEVDPTKPIALSNSSASTFSSCERKGYHQYIAKTKIDSDWIRPGYFAFGSAYHGVLEKSWHDARRFNNALAYAQVKKEKLIWQNDGAKIMACVNAYFEMIKDSIYKPIAFEKWFENDLARGKIDLVLEAPNGWYISDTKTSGMALSPTKLMELINDPQMNLYGAFHDIIAKKLGLDPKKWLGVIYRETEKPRHQYKILETFDSFYGRIVKEGLPKTRELVISRDELNWDNAYNNFLLMVKRAREIQNEWLKGNVPATRQDFNSCKKFGNPCEYWSQCYNCLYYSQPSDKLKTILDLL